MQADRRCQREVLRSIRLVAKRERFSHDAEDFSRIHEAFDFFRLRPAGSNDQVIDGVNALAFIARQVSFDEVTALAQPGAVGRQTASLVVSIPAVMSEEPSV